MKKKKKTKERKVAANVKAATNKSKDDSISLFAIIDRSISVPCSLLQ